MKMNKKIIIIVALLILTVLFGITYFKNRNNQKNLNKIQSVLTEKVYFPSMNEDGTILYFYSTEKKPGLYKTELSNLNNQQLSEALGNIEEITWSPDKQNIIIKIKYDDSFNQSGSFYQNAQGFEDVDTYWLFDIKTQKAIQIGKYTLGANFDYSGKRIIYYEYDYQDTIDQLKICDLQLEKCSDGEAMKYPLGLTILSLNENEMILYANSTEADIDSLFKLNINSGSVEEIQKDLLISSAITSLRGSKIIYSSSKSEGKAQYTSVLDISKKSNKTFDRFFNPIDCVISSNEEFAFCFKQNQKKNDLYKVTLKNGKSSLFVSINNNEEYLPENLYLSSDGQTLYYTFNDFLKKISL